MKVYDIFDQVVAIIAGKPQDERYYNDYKQILRDETVAWNLPLLFNVNIGHAYRRTALPYGAEAVLDCPQQTLTITEPFFS